MMPRPSTALKPTADESGPLLPYNASMIASSASIEQQIAAGKQHKTGEQRHCALKGFLS